MRKKLSALLMSRESHCEQNDQIQCAHLNILSKNMDYDRRKGYFYNYNCAHL